MGKLIAQGTSVEEFKQAVARTPGDGLTTLEIDVRANFATDHMVRVSLPAMDGAIRAIPGVHLKAPSTYSVRDGVGTVRMQLYTNPLPFIPIAVATVIVLGGLGISAVVAWRIFHASPAEALGMLLIVGLLVAAAAVIILAKPGSIKAIGAAARGG